MSEVEQAPGQPQEPVQGAPEAESPPAELETTDETTAPGEEGEESTEPKKQPWYQKRIDEITAARREAERQNERLLALLEQATRQQPAPEPPPPAAQAPEAPPTQDQYPDWEQFVKATAIYEARQVLAQERRQQAQQAEIQAAQQRAMEFDAKLQERLAQSPDLQQVWRTATFPVTDTVRDALHNLPNGADVALYLAQNRAEVDRLNSLPDATRVGIALGLMAAKVQPPAPKRVTQPPQPINSLGGGTAPAPFDPAKIKTADEYQAWRMKDLEAKRNG